MNNNLHRLQRVFNETVAAITDESANATASATTTITEQ